MKIAQIAGSYALKQNSCLAPSCKMRIYQYDCTGGMRLCRCSMPDSCKCRANIGFRGMHGKGDEAYCPWLRRRKTP